MAKTVEKKTDEKVDWFEPLTDWDPVLSGSEHSPDVLSGELMDRYKREEEAFRPPPRRVKRARRSG